jgi:hypothetical protein
VGSKLRAILHADIAEPTRFDPSRTYQAYFVSLAAPVHVEDSYVIVVETQRVAVGKWAHPGKIDLSAGPR